MGTSDGCAVRALKEAGLAKRSADPDAYYRSYYNYGYNPYYNRYNGFYNYYGGYNGYYNYPYAYNPYVPYVAPAPVEAAEAEPEVEAAPVPLVAAAPYYYNTPVVAAPAPVVKTVSKPVTYTHLGAHPIQPTTVLETDTHLVY